MNNLTLTLVAPDFSGFDRVARRPDPSVLWPVGPQSLAAHWLDHAVRLGCKRVVLHVSDRPSEVRTELGDGTFWSLQLEVSSQPAPAGALEMLGLPGQPVPTAPTSPAGLLEWWFELNLQWLNARDRAAVSIDRLDARGGWLAPRVQIHPSAILVAPFWIGTDTVIGPGCRIGPGALIGAGCLLEGDVRVENSLVLGGTFLGRHLDVCARIVEGGTLLNRASGIGIVIKDSFIASTLSPALTRVPWSERLLAALLWLPAALAALGAGAATRESFHLPDGQPLTLSTRPAGSLLARRAGWLRHVVTGHLRLFGALPRSTTPDLPRESRRLLEAARPGVFALSDLHGIHSPTEAGEAVHALYQAADPAAQATVRKNLFRLCRLQPSPLAA